MILKINHLDTKTEAGCDTAFWENVKPRTDEATRVCEQVFIESQAETYMVIFYCSQRPTFSLAAVLQ